jgi:hypothetical protein
MPAAGFEPLIPAIELLQTSAIDLTATGIGCCILRGDKFTSPMCCICLVFCSSNFVLVSLLSNTLLHALPSTSSIESLHQIKSTVVPVRAVKTYWGRKRRYPLILNLDEWLNSRPGRFTAGKEPWHPLNRRWVGHRANPDVLPLSGVEAQTVQPILQSLFRQGYPDSIALERHQTLQGGENLPYGRTVLFSIIPTQTQTQTQTQTPISYLHKHKHKPQSHTYTIALHVSYLYSAPLN